MNKTPVFMKTTDWRKRENIIINYYGQSYEKEESSVKVIDRGSPVDLGTRWEGPSVSWHFLSQCS